MRNMIEVQPTPEQRRPFAVWAVAQNPKLRTIGTNLFAVPAELFVDIPESILIGSRVDGHRYVSPDEDTAVGRPAPGSPDQQGQARLLGCGLCYEEDGEEVHPHPECTVQASELLGVATPDGFAREVLVGDAGPEAVIPLGPTAAPDSSAGDGPLACPDCSRHFTTSRGLDSHRRQIHPEA